MFLYLKVSVTDDISENVVLFSNNTFCKKNIIKTFFAQLKVDLRKNLSYGASSGVTCLYRLCECREMYVSNDAEDFISKDLSELDFSTFCIKNKKLIIG